MFPCSPLLLSLLGAVVVNSIPSPPLYFQNLVDHFDPASQTYTQRYYQNLTAFKGPGSPIIVIMGGEGAISPDAGIYYPPMVIFAERVGGAVVEPEHRYFGTSLPTAPYDTHALRLLTAEQALADAAVLIQAKRAEFKCSGEGGEPRCPVVVCGGSYPAFLAAMMRLRYPHIVDMSYAASAPMLFYSQKVNQYDYYRVVTEAAGQISPSCPASVRTLLAHTLAAPATTKDAIATGLNLCTPLPQYLQEGDLQLLVDEVSMVISYTFADLNMGNYPPSTPDHPTRLFTACSNIVAGVQAGSFWPTLATFLSGYSQGAAHSGTGGSCYNISSQLPSGDNATISSGDWSGVGTGQDGSSWDFETCTYLVEAIGMNNVTDMFLPRVWSLEWLTAHCQLRFGVTPQPRALPELWGFDEDALPNITSRIIFTNGLQDGWSAGGIQRNLSDTLLAYNAPYGAHHSDLNHLWPSDLDSPDIIEVRELVAAKLVEWLGELQQ